MLADDGAVEQEHVLLDDADQVAVAVDVDVAQVAAVEQDAAAGGVVEAGDEVAERGLAAAAGADEGDRFAGLDVERDVFERERAGAGVAERDAVERDAAVDLGARSTFAAAVDSISRGSSSRSRMRSRPERPFWNSAALWASTASGPSSISR